MSWKIVAIIFMVLFALETIAVFYLIGTGLEQDEKETKCSNYCSARLFIAYNYEPVESLCMCLNETGDLAQTIPIN